MAPSGHFSRRHIWSIIIGRSNGTPHQIPKDIVILWYLVETSRKVWPREEALHRFIIIKIYVASPMLISSS
jgi:hypothetical protein